MQTRLYVSLHDPTELEEHGLFGLRHDVEAVPGQYSQDHATYQGNQ
jgi:hypothetical protein